MSLSVRYPTGLTVHYNDAHFLRYMGGGGCELFSADPDKGGVWIASIQASSGAIVETRRPCRVEFEALTLEKAVEALGRDPAELRKLPTWLVRALKRHLVPLNARSGVWS